jgi:tetratricopeptide (TPR) repeat protein
MYPRWHPDLGSVADWIPSLLVLVVTGVAWRYRRRISRGIYTAIFFFLGTIFPVVGFLNVYGMRFASVADHWVYVSSLGFFALLAAGVTRLATQVRAAWIPTAFAAVLLPVVAMLSWREAHQYRDHETLWLTTRAKDPHHWMPHYSLGLLATGAGRPAEALAHFQRSVALRPQHAIAYSNIGAALAQLGRDAEAIAAFRQSLAQGSPIPETRSNLALSLLRTGDAIGAILELREALALDPTRADFHRTLGAACERQGMTAEAVASYREAMRLAPADSAAPLALGLLFLKAGENTEALAPLRLATSLSPDSAIAHANLTVALVETGAFDAAIESAQRALTLNPALRSVHQNLGLAYLQRRRYGEALEAFLEAARRNPTLAAASANAALILAASPDATQRDGPRALEMVKEADELSGGKDLQMRRALAAAYAECARYAEAAAIARRGADLAAQGKHAPLRDTLLQDEQRYRQNQPLRLPTTQ